MAWGRRQAVIGSDEAIDEPVVVVHDPIPGGLDSLDISVVHLFALVSEGIVACTSTFLSSDRDAVHALMANEQLIDSVYGKVEELARNELVSGNGTSEERLRLLLLVLQIVPELERSGDLVEHIARRAAQGLARSLTPRTLGIIDRMGTVAAEMWQLAATAYLERDPAAADHLRRRDDELDDLHVTLTAELATGSLPLAAAIEMGLVARFFERLGDHAVNVARRLDVLWEAQ